MVFALFFRVFVLFLHIMLYYSLVTLHYGNIGEYRKGGNQDVPCIPITLLFLNIGTSLSYAQLVLNLPINSVHYMYIPANMCLFT